MYEIDNVTAVSVMPSPGSPGPVPNGYFVANTVISQTWMNTVQSELSNVIIGAGLELEKGNQSQLLAAINALIASITPTPKIEAIVEDLNPHLGADLNLNDFSIYDLSNVIPIEAGSGGKVIFMAPNVKAASVRAAGDSSTFIDLENMSISSGGTTVLNMTSDGLQIGTGARIKTIVSVISSATGAISTQKAARDYVSSKSKDEMFYLTPSFPVSVIAFEKTGWELNPNTSDALKNYFTVKRGGTISKLKLHWGFINASDIPNDLVVTLLVNGVVTALTATIGAAHRTPIPGGGYYNRSVGEDLVHEIPVIAGDRLQFKFASNGAYASSNNRDSIHLSFSIKS